MHLSTSSLEQKARIPLLLQLHALPTANDLQPFFHRYIHRLLSHPRTPNHPANS
jgi:hypothetical protein